MVNDPRADWRLQHPNHLGGLTFPNLQILLLGFPIREWRVRLDRESSVPQRGIEAALVATYTLYDLPSSGCSKAFY